MKRLAIPAALLLLLSGCPGDDDDDGVICGPGTIQNGTQCVPEVVGGNNGANNGGAAATCGPGTSLNPETNVCEVENANVTECGEGTSLNPDTGECETSGPTISCAEGTVLVEGECVAENPCPEGSIFRDGECTLAEDLCGEGTVFRDGSCVPIDPLEGVDASEADENNDPVYGGTAGAIAPGAVGEPNWVKGTIGAPADLDGEAETLEGDFDGFRLSAEAGQRIELQVVAVGAPAMALSVGFEGEGLPEGYRRLAIPYGSRTASRVLVAPATGDYLVRVGELSNFAGVGGAPTGSDDFTYLFGAALLEGPPAVSGVVGEDVEGDILDVPEVQFTGEALGVWVDANPSVDLSWFTATTGEAGYTPGTRYLEVPEAGISVYVDYVSAAAEDTSFTLRTEAVTLIAESEPNQTAEDAGALGTLGTARVVGQGGFEVVDVVNETTTDDWWSFTLDADTNVVLQTEARLAPGNTTLAVFAADAVEQPIAVDDDGNGLYSRVSATLDAGDYLVLVRSADDLRAGDYFLTLTAD